MCVCECLLLLAFLFTTHANAKPPTDSVSQKIPEAAKRRIQATLLRAPLSFEANQGQTDEQVKFLARGPGYQLFLTSTEAVMVLRQAGGSRRSAIGNREKLADRLLARSNPKSEIENPKSQVVRMTLRGANPEAEVVGVQELPGKVNYFIGNDPKKWRTNIPTYKRIEYKDIYPGVNMVYYGNQGQLEYDFVVSPGADPSAIQLAFEGSDKVEMDAKGDLILKTASGDLRLHKPLVYQEIAGVRREISATFVLNPNCLESQSKIVNPKSQVVGFRLAAYDASKPLVIDPVLSYATYLGGSGSDGIVSISVDSAGNAYVAGSTTSVNFPTANAFQPLIGGSEDVIVAKLNANGSALLYSTYLGGRVNERAVDIAVDSSGAAYVTGDTNSADFPTTPGAFQTAFAGGDRDAFVFKLNGRGDALEYSTYLGGRVSGRALCCGAGDSGRGIAVDATGNAYVVGETDSDDFPITAGAFQTTPGGGSDEGFITKINATGSGLVYSSYIGGSDGDDAEGVAVDSDGNAYVAGGTRSRNFPVTPGSFQTSFGGGENDLFIIKVNPSGSSLVSATYLGGGDREQGGRGIAIDSLGNVYVAGWSEANVGGGSLIGNFPVAGGAFQGSPRGGGSEAFVTKLNPSVSALVYSTYLGGSGHEALSRISLDGSGNAYVVGHTSSRDFPTASPLQAGLSGSVDAFVTVLNPTGSGLIYSTYLGGSGDEEGRALTVDSSGNAYVVGLTNSIDFPTTGGAFQPVFAGGGDAFVAKIIINQINQPPTASAGGPYTVAEGGTLATLTGSGSDPDGDPLTYTWDLDNNGSFETSGQNPTFSAAGRDGPSSQTVVLKVCDSKGACATSTATVNITNVAPTVGAISAPAAPVQVNTLITTSATFTDPGVLDTHTAVWNWGDGTTSAGAVTETNGSGSATGSHVYTAAGVYTVTLTVTDDDGGSRQSVFQFVVVYDPNAGFVTGGGWIDSPAGAYTANPSLTGKANFGFVSRYRPGATVPEGQTEFRFSVANLNFHSTNYEWLVVGGARAQYKGTGAINGAGSYNFILTAIDGQVAGGGGVDKFRIKIWGTGGVIYDNQMGAADGADPTTQLGGGSIVIHTQ